MTDRTDRYMARLSQHLWWMHDNAERRDFLIGELAKWEERYEAFMRKVDGGGNPGDVSAFDFTNTIAALNIELGKVSQFPRIDTTELKQNIARLEKAVS